jgi:hypothetical protein
LKLPGFFQENTKWKHTLEVEIEVKARDCYGFIHLAKHKSRGKEREKSPPVKINRRIAWQMPTAWDKILHQ